MPISPAKLERIFDLLTERELSRLQYAQPTRATLSKEQEFYSVRNSLANRVDNRYSNILAYDRTAVVVDGDYLNANLVQDGKGGEWIAAQAPPPHAFPTFFKALYTGAATRRRGGAQRPQGAVVVQLTGWKENGMLKADPYLPEAEHRVGDLILKHGQRRDVPQMSTVISELSLRPVSGSLADQADGSSEMPVWHYHFAAWPDHGVPRGEAVAALRDLIAEIERQKRETDCEVWVHCSAGVGRTGTFIALSSLLNPGHDNEGRKPWQPSALGAVPKEIAEDPVALTVDTIRECRGMMVQNIDQLKLIYDMQP